MMDLAALFHAKADHDWADGLVELVPLASEHREGLRACCIDDDPVWPVYSVNFAGDDFDPAFDALIANGKRHVFVVMLDGEIVGMTSYLAVATDRDTVEIGGTFMAPKARGTGINARAKRLMLDSAFASGVRRVEFRIDARNTRSQAAVEKLGAKKEGVLRAERITWTGHVRDTVMFSILAEEWKARL